MEEIPTKSAKSITLRFRLRVEDSETLFVVRHSRVPNDMGETQAAISQIGVRVRVASLSRSREFYEGTLGLRPSRTGDSFARYGDALALELWPGNAEPMGHAEPNFVIQLVAANVEVLHSTVQSSGEQVVEPLREENGRARFTCTDPDGNLIEVAAPQPPR